MSTISPADFQQRLVSRLRDDGWQVEEVGALEIRVSAAGEKSPGIFNLTNRATYLSQNNAFGPTLDRVQTVLDGRVVRLGVQVAF